MTQFTRQGSAHFPHNDNNLVVRDRLPAGYHSISVHPERGFFFLDAEPMVLPSKTYGNVNDVTERVLTTFVSRSGNTGVLLAGDKGSGKSLQMKLICAAAVSAGLPVITVSEPMRGEAFNRFITSLRQPFVLTFDEFEKVYDESKGEQTELLSLMDGVYNSQALFLFTVNDAKGVNKFMVNRPGRIFYLLNYKGMEESAIVEYCKDQLKDQSHIDQILAMSTMIGSFSFDILKALVEEMNRYSEGPMEAVRVLNIRPDPYGSNYKFTAELSAENGKLPRALCDEDYKFEEGDAPDIKNVTLRYDETIHPGLTHVLQFNISYRHPRLGHEDGGAGHYCEKSVVLTRQSLVHSDMREGVWVYSLGSGKLTVRRSKRSTYDPLGAWA